MLYRVLPFLKPDVDTSYVVPESNAFSIKPYTRVELGMTSYELSDTTTNETQTFKVSDTGQLYTGLGIAYRGFSFSHDINPATVFGHKKKTGYNLNFSLYGQNAGADLFFSTSSRNKLTDSNDKALIDGTTDCVQTSRLKASIYYVIKNKQFSIPAIFEQSYIQKKNAGSIIAGASVTNTLTIVRHNAIPEQLDSVLMTNNMFRHYRQTMVCLSVGYGRNSIHNRMLFHWSVQPALPVYSKYHIILIDGTDYKSDQWGNNFSVKATGAAQWHYNHHSVCLNIVIDANIMTQGYINATDAFFRGSLSYRYMF